MYQFDLIDSAERLASSANGVEPTQADLKLAVRATYFAVFGAGCCNCADCFIGSSETDRLKHAWLRAYRAPDHRFAKLQCSNNAELSKFSEGIRVYAETLVEYQDLRECADYDPWSIFNQDEALDCVTNARSAIQGLLAAPMEEREWLATWMTIKNRQS